MALLPIKIGPEGCCGQLLPTLQVLLMESYLPRRSWQWRELGTGRENRASGDHPARRVECSVRLLGANGAPRPLLDRWATFVRDSYVVGLSHVMAPSPPTWPCSLACNSYCPPSPSRCGVTSKSQPIERERHGTEITDEATAEHLANFDDRATWATAASVFASDTLRYYHT